MTHQTRRMLYMAQENVADSPFQADCLKFLNKLRGATGRELSHSVLLKRMKTNAKHFADVVATLEQRGEITTRTQSSAGRPGRYYRLSSSGESIGAM